MSDKPASNGLEVAMRTPSDADKAEWRVAKRLDLAGQLFPIAEAEACGWTLVCAAMAELDAVRRAA